MSDTAAKPKNKHFEMAHILSEALPYMQRYDDKTVVVKYGGHAMGDPRLAKQFAHDIVLLKQSGMNPIVVHGGGPQIAEMLEKLNIKSEFKGGLRVTTDETIEIVEMVLAGKINKQIVAAINNAGGVAVGICGKDGNLIIAEKLTKTIKDPDSAIEKVLDLGHVGAVKKVNRGILDSFQEGDIIPVIAPIGTSESGQTYNINADTAAGAIASAMNAKRLLMLTDIVGVLDGNKKLIRELSEKLALELIDDGTIAGGMIPKVENCLNVINNGVEAATILDGREEHAVLLELFTDHGAGTQITKI